MLSIKEISSTRNYILLNLFTILTPVILYPFITRIISTESYGNYIFIQSIALLILAISNFGCLVGFKRNYFEYSSKKKRYILLSFIQIFIFFVFFLVLSINFIFEEYIFRFINKTDISHSFWSLILLAISFDFFSKYYLTYLVNEEKSKLYCILIITKNFFYVFFTLIFFFYDFKILSLVYSLLISNSVLFILILLIQLKEQKITFQYKQVIKILKISYPLTLRILFGELNTKLDKILITILAGVSGTGIYTVAQSISYFVFQFITSLDKVFITKLNKKLFSGNHNIKNYLTPYLFISAAVALLLILFNDIIYLILIDKKYHGAENIVIILTLYYFFLFFNKVTGAQLIYIKKIWLISNLFFLSVVGNFILNLFFIKYFGIIGAATATLINSLFFTFIQIYLSSKFMKLRLNLKDIYLICGLLIIFSFIQLLLNNFFAKDFSLTILIIKLFFFTIFLYLGHKFNLFQYKKFIKNFIKI